MNEFSNNQDIFSQEILTKQDWKDSRWNNSGYLKFKLPKKFLDILNPDNKSISLLNNYCEIITKTKKNIRTFKINLWIQIIRFLINFLLVILNAFLLIFQSQIENPNAFLIGILATWSLSTFPIYIYFLKLGFYTTSVGKNIIFNNYKIHLEYLRCKFAIAANEHEEKNKDIEKVRILFKANLYKFIDEDKLIILENKKIHYKNYSKSMKWFLMYGCIIINEAFIWIPILSLFLSLLHFQGYLG